MYVYCWHFLNLSLFFSFARSLSFSLAGSPSLSLSLSLPPPPVPVVGLGTQCDACNIQINGLSLRLSRFNSWQFCSECIGSADMCV